jgi:hypothetical protein
MVTENGMVTENQLQESEKETFWTAVIHKSQNLATKIK